MFAWRLGACRNGTGHGQVKALTVASCNSKSFCENSVRLSQKDDVQDDDDDDDDDDDADDADDDDDDDDDDDNEDEDEDEDENDAGM
eukprot:s530_g13.t1